jgi:hypothetical protein
MINEKYIPESLSAKDKEKAKKNILESREAYKKGKFIERIKLDSAKTKQSSWTKNFHNKYGNISKEEIIQLLKDKGSVKPEEAIEKIIKKGKGAFYSSGSRPNQSAFSWSWGRLYSVLLGGFARKIDKQIVEDHKLPLL